VKTTHKKKSLGDIGVALVVVGFAAVVATALKLDHTYASLSPVLAAWLFGAALTIGFAGLLLTFLYKLRPAANH
jgi:predicted benzoate:H+ symporter BenE